MSVVALDRVMAKAPGWAVATQLARREGLRMIRHPVFVTGAFLSLAMFGLLTWQSAPVLHRDDVAVAGGLLPLAAVTLIVANLAASRSARNSTDELYDGTSTSGGLRTIGHLLSLAFPLAASIGVAAVMFVYMLLDSPVGTPRIAELLVGPVSVALLGTIGIAIGRWKAHAALGPMAVVAIVALETLLIQPVISLQGTVGDASVRTPWFGPWVPMSLTGEVPSELVIRPAAWHLLFLVGVCIALGAVAVARYQRGPRVVATLVVGVAGIVLGSVGQLAPPTASQRAALAALVEHPEQHQVCEERGGVTYCAYPAYAPWIDRWAAPVEGALARIPADARPEGLVVRQTFGSYFEGPTDLPADTVRAIERDHRRSLRSGTSEPIFYTGTRWGRGETEGTYEIGLALYVAMEALDFPSSRAEMVLMPEDVARLKQTMIPTVPKRFRAKAERDLVAGRRQGYCYTTGQARALVAWWIAGQATPATRAAVTRVSGENPYGLTIYEFEGQRIATYIGPFIPLYPLAPPPMWDRVSFADAEFHYAAQLLEEPAEQVATVLSERWSELSLPAATTASVLDEIHLEAHPTIEEQIAALPDGVELERGRRMWNPEAYYAGTIPCP